MSRLEQICERINDTFVVKCVEQIQPETYLGLEISDFISAIIAFFSVLAASFAGYAAWKANKLSESEAKANREHNYQSVRPLLDVEYSREIYPHGLIRRIAITNHGVGAACFKRVQLYSDDKQYDLSNKDSDLLKAFLLHLIPEHVKAGEFGVENFKPDTTAISEGTFFGADKKMVILQVSLMDMPSEVVSDISDAIGKIQVRAEYACVYEQKYILDTLITKN